MGERPSARRLGRAFAAFLVLLGALAMAACGGPDAQGPASSSGPSSSETATGTATAEATAPVSTGGTSSTGAGEIILLYVVPGGSEARYRVQEQLAGQSFWNDAVGSTSEVSGRITVGPSGAIVPENSGVTVDVVSIESDSARRDSYVRANTLATERYSTAEFVPREAPGLPLPLPTSGEAQFRLVGDLTIHGVTQPATWETTARFGEREVTASATTSVNVRDFGMEPPQVGPVLGIKEEATLELDLRLRREDGAG